MPTTRKRVIKTVYKDEDESEAEGSVGDFSDSGSEAEIPDAPSSDEEEEAVSDASAEEFVKRSRKTLPKAKTKVVRKKFAKELINKINRQSSAGDDLPIASIPLFTVRDLAEEDKLLPPVLDLSESDSSDDETPKASYKKPAQTSSGPFRFNQDSDSEKETPTEYKDVWSNNIKDNSEEVAQKTFMELEQHKTQLEETKATLLNYKSTTQSQGAVSDVKDLLALGEEVLPEVQQPIPTTSKKGRKGKKSKDDSDSEIEDWEEVKDAKTIPQQGLQLIVDFPDAACRKSKKIDVEMMMKRKINRVKKEYQVYMHKVHVLCWLAHGNFVSRVLNDQEVLAAVLSLVPSKECYPGERVDMKYLEHITTWYRDKFTLKQDKNEEKYRPKAPPLKTTLVGQTKTKIVTTKKYLVFIFVSMLRALGLQSRVMFNFTTLPIKPPSSELCSLSTKPKDEKKTLKENDVKAKPQTKKDNKSKSKGKIPQIDGNNDCFSSDDDSYFSDIMQLDGNDDVAAKIRSTRATRANKNNNPTKDDDDVSPPKKPRKSASTQKEKPAQEVKEVNGEINKLEPEKRRRPTRQRVTEESKSTSNKTKDKAPPKQSLSRRKNKTDDSKVEKMDVEIQHKSASHKASPQKNITTSKASTNRSTRSNKYKEEMVKNDSKPEKMEVDEQKASESPKQIQQKPVTSSTKLSLRVNKDSQAEDKTSNEAKNRVLKSNPPQIVVTPSNSEDNVSSKYFGNDNLNPIKKLSLSRNRSQTTNPSSQKLEIAMPKSRTKSAPGNPVDKGTSKYFDEKTTQVKKGRLLGKKDTEEDKQRVSHRDLLAKNKTKPRNDITGDLVDIIKKRVKEAKHDSKKGKVKVEESDGDSDHLPEEPKRRKSESDEDFKPCKISPKPSSSKKIDRRVLSSESEELPKNKCDVWCEVFVEELEQWIAVDVVKAKVHCTNELYNRATHPVCYVVGWDNNNYLKDLTRRYVPHWNTVTRKQRAEPLWWDTAIKPWLGPKTARDREEDEQLDRMQLDAPLPKSISEYKNHPLYALKRHLLKYEAIYPPDAPTLGFVRNEPVYARECVYVCRSRDTWLKEAKVVKLGEQPYKVVKARPKWDRLSNKLITDKPLEVFGPWQTMDYEPPVAENGLVPRNAYGNVELFKDCMLPKGTVHIKLPGLNRVAKKLNIDCAPAMTGFDFNGGWSHPVYDGFVVCKEFEEIVTEAWLKDQEDQERREREKIETRVFGNWRRLIKGLLIRERLKNKYGFEKPPAEPASKKKGPKLVVKKK